MEPVFSWLDPSEAVRRRVLGALAGLQDRDTRDELGLGAISYAISERLFPGTAVGHTRPRYLFFVYWIYRQLEAKPKVTSENVADRARYQEVRLIRELLNSTEEEDVIGRISLKKLKILPSTRYWSALRSLGFQQLDLSQGEYHERFDELRRRRSSIYDDDENPVAGRDMPFWCPHVPQWEEDQQFPVGATLPLTRNEAKFLKDQYQFRYPDSVYEGSAKIERHVPALPLSRDRQCAIELQRALAVYRMVFGQPRQDDLIEYLLQRLGRDEIEQILEQIRLDLSPRLTTRGSTGKER